MSIRDGLLQGHVLWLRPEYRGRGLVRRYFEAALDLCRERGLEGMYFLSTLDRWRRDPHGFRMGWSMKQAGGPPVQLYWKEA